ncbi:cysteine proteinase ACP1 precursor, putative [Entamoeba dispar SAW760]|uniref:Cysteine proteinase ACP1, putative n=1 Tax=Entamoeba dispar (strain ATCC PRA-260 / SAW760) TaxID=370354 RepID=B0E5V3_ENTDS|nr:cysteine proteinase ACP1 precursor, putative [Entamoeba dispar SAW760]EDR30071.1 cysteine proteinase ACP1 precursor, putative [Entamoeba dispar SAW760]|eukprot:EDR30071.1 cysteine proteinase ACP1 precursor, putative [Entamoeba dispar SAW760]
MFAVILLGLCANAITFDQWQSKYKFKFSPVERLRRKAIFTSNFKYVKEFNKNHDFELSVEGPYAALTSEEYQALLNKQIIGNENKNIEVINLKSNKQVPASVDWRAEGKVTPIKDQGSCGSCFTFGAVAAIESRLLISGTTGYTAQTLIFLNNKFLIVLFLLMDDNPYTGKDGKCLYDKTKVKVSIEGLRTADISDTALTAAIADAPVGVCIDASQTSFQLYKSGVYDEPKCKKIMNHCVAAVGYGSQDGKDYYIVKNSWGTTWGMDGYILMSRNKNNQCGICTGISFPVGVKLI